MRRRFLLFLAYVPQFWLIGSIRSLAQDAPKEPPTTFVLRVNPKWASRVNALLKRIANPTEIVLPSGATPDSLARSLCAGRQIDIPTVIENEPGKIRITPCVLIKTGVEVKVREPSTLEGIAVRNGLSPSDGPTLKVVRAGSAHLVQPQELQIGDVVRIPEVPLWTTVAIRDDSIKDRKSMLQAIGEAVDCKASDQDHCLLHRGIYVLEGAGGKHTPAFRAKPPLEKFEPEGVLDLPATGGFRRVYNMLSEAPPAAIVASVRLIPPANTIPVDPAQWPYDVNLLAAILQDVHDPIRATVGVADLGLADSAGAPLPADLFDQSDEERPGYVNDTIGAGVKRSLNDIAATGDVSLCGGAAQPPFAGWGQKLELASHASIAVSLAAGLPVRQRYAAAAPRLPRLVFFRMVPNACEPNGSLDPGEGAMAPAFTYLAQRSGVVTFSFMNTSPDPSGFVTAMQATLPYGEQILVLPSGNDIPGDLDKTPFSPQLLGSVEMGIQTANRTIVVGSATRQLMRANYSNYGDDTVSLYAPGEPTGALNLAGQDASALAPATSYAAPQVALAAGILKSFGYFYARDVKDRLSAATWPLAGTQRSRIGVVDLVKAAAIRHHIVEVIEPGPDGAPVRRTYAGKLQEKLQDLAICKGYPLFESTYHAVRIEGAGPERHARAYKKNDYEPKGGPLSGRRKIMEIDSCRSEGQLHINDLLAGQKTFPLSSVTEIQLPWVPSQ